MDAQRCTQEGTQPALVLASLWMPSFALRKVHSLHWCLHRCGCPALHSGRYTACTGACIVMDAQLCTQEGTQPALVLASLWMPSFALRKVHSLHWCLHRYGCPALHSGRYTACTGASIVVDTQLCTQEGTQPALVLASLWMPSFALRKVHSLHWCLHRCGCPALHSGRYTACTGACIVVDVQLCTQEATQPAPVLASLWMPSFALRKLHSLHRCLHRCGCPVLHSGSYTACTGACIVVDDQLRTQEATQPAPVLASLWMPSLALRKVHSLHRCLHRYGCPALHSGRYTACTDACIVVDVQLCTQEATQPALVLASLWMPSFALRKVHSLH
ncbi:hypothetical protein NDU88_000945 [Pleurodeles waltl]|uniref:Uncharacterized protein n=1 Tax=Pleurodeles waltl TaxID=8319 RepID=A0AAV7MJ56_PLEWA|nr:hypothetical protein NDU88_000945 [Pleurodeles waltl]